MRMDHGIAWYRDVNSSSLKKEFGYLVPLRVSKSLSGPIKLEVDEKKIFTVGREHPFNRYFWKGIPNFFRASERASILPIQPGF